MKIITLTTDFGLVDSYVAIMKGVILSIAPGVRIVDITHAVPPHNVTAAAYALQRAVPYFPPGTVHVAVVDPGVGSARRPLAIHAADAYFIGPDNGLFSEVLTKVAGGEPKAGEEAPSVICLDQPAYWLPAVSQTFHGRDIFAPAAAHLAAGAPFETLGSPIDDPVVLPPASSIHLDDGSIRGQIVHVDHFGNLISNVPADWLAGQSWSFAIASHTVAGLSPAYAAVARGQALALIGSSGALEIAVRDGSAAERLEVQAGEPIEARSNDG